MKLFSGTSFWFPRRNGASPKSQKTRELKGELNMCEGQCIKVHWFTLHLNCSFSAASCDEPDKAVHLHHRDFNLITKSQLSIWLWIHEPSICPYTAHPRLSLVTPILYIWCTQGTPPPMARPSLALLYDHERCLTPDQVGLRHWLACEGSWDIVGSVPWPSISLLSASTAAGGVHPGILTTWHLILTPAESWGLRGVENRLKSCSFQSPSFKWSFHKKSCFAFSCVHGTKLKHYTILYLALPRDTKSYIFMFLPKLDKERESRHEHFLSNIFTFHFLSR